jgi:hypothetical protein
MHVPKHFWNDAILSTRHLINRMSSTFLDGAFSYSILFPSSPVFLLPPRVFGCVCYIHNLGPGFANLIIVLPSVFLGYSLTHMGYRCYFQSYSSILQVLMLLLLSFSHISLEPVLQMTMSSSCLHHLLSLFRLRVLYLPPLFLYLPPCLCLCKLQLRSSSQPRDLASSTDSDSPPIALRKGTCSCVAKHPIGNFVSY